MISTLSKIIFETCCRYTQTNTTMHIPLIIPLENRIWLFTPYFNYIFIFCPSLPARCQMIYPCPTETSEHVTATSWTFYCSLSFLCLNQSFSRALVFPAISPSNSTFPPFIQYMVFNITILIPICWAS